MRIVINDTWLYFCITFGVMLLTTFIMGLLGRKFFTHDGATRAFSIMDLEFAANGKEITNIMNGIFALPANPGGEVVKALKRQLYLDFLFMPAAYGSIFLLCMEVASKLTTGVGETIFATLAWMQFIPWLADIAENIFLLRRIAPNLPAIPDNTFKLYRTNEWLKWGIALTGAVVSLASMLYFWLTGNYENDSLMYLIILTAELAVFMWLTKRFAAKAPGITS